MALDPQRMTPARLVDLAGQQRGELTQRQGGGRERMHAVVQVVGVAAPERRSRRFVVRRAGRGCADGEAVLRRRHGVHIVAQAPKLGVAVLRPYHECRVAGDAQSAQGVVGALVVGHRAALVGRFQFLVGDELEADEHPVQADLLPAAQQFRVAQDGGGARPGEVAFLDAAFFQCLGQFEAELFVDEILVVGEVDVVDLDPRDILGHHIDQSRHVGGAAQERHDAERAGHLAAVGSARHRDRGKQHLPIARILVDPDAGVGPAVPQIAARDRDGSRIGIAGPNRSGGCVETVAGE